MSARTALGYVLAAVAPVLVGLAGYALAIPVWRWYDARWELIDNAFDNQPASRSLLIGDVNHGLAFVAPADPALRGDPKKDLSRLATTYYHRSGPLGKAMEKSNWFPGPVNTYAADARLPASLVGAGAVTAGPVAQLVSLWSEPPYGVLLIKDGVLASYARPCQPVDFYERSPGLARLSFGPPSDATFAFVPDAIARGARARLIEGEELDSLRRKGPERYYHLLVLELARGSGYFVCDDQLTDEAFALYFERLADEGIVCLHTSSRHYDIPSQVQNVASRLGLIAVRAHDHGGSRSSIGHFQSEWVMVARRPEHLRHFLFGRRVPEENINWVLLPDRGQQLWRDDFGPVRR